jgi:hypothetical protein
MFERLKAEHRKSGREFLNHEIFESHEKMFSMGSAIGFVAQFVPIGNATRNEDENCEKKRVFIGEYEELYGAGAQRGSFCT